jgi:hypothetical protein
MDKYFLEELYRDAQEECTKDNKYRLNFGVYFTPKHQWES